MYHVAYLEPSRICMMGVFEKIGNGFKQLTIFSKKSSIGQVQLVYKYPYVSLVLL